jgi:hypothetical protein
MPWAIYRRWVPNANEGSAVVAARGRFDARRTRLRSLEGVSISVKARETT